jgi:acyl-CoA thioester hydrolase
VSEPHLPVLADGVLVARVRVNYSEVDQMGVVYHARYLVWLDIARTEYLRQTGVSYRELETRGYRLVVAELGMRYLCGAAYDDALSVRCWVRDLASRRVTFGYAIERTTDDALLATATTAMFVLDSGMRPTRLPEDVAQRLLPISDPVRL